MTTKEELRTMVDVLDHAAYVYGSEVGRGALFCGDMKRETCHKAYKTLLDAIGSLSTSVDMARLEQLLEDLDRVGYTRGCGDFRGDRYDELLRKRGELINEIKELVKQTPVVATPKPEEPKTCIPKPLVALEGMLDAGLSIELRRRWKDASYDTEYQAQTHAGVSTLLGKGPELADAIVALYHKWCED